MSAPTPPLTGTSGAPATVPPFDQVAVRVAPGPDLVVRLPGVLLVVLVLGVLWEFVYHGIQQFRWEKDWPTLFGLLTGIPEGLLVWFLFAGGAIPWVDSLPGPAFAIHFASTWLIVWLVANGPMRVPFIHWRINGGRLI